MYERQYPLPPNHFEQTYEQPFHPQQPWPMPHFIPPPPPPMHPFQPIPFQQMQGQPFNYPQHNQSSRPPLSASVLNQFQDADGQIDINKMLATVGQLANTVQQVTPVIKQVGSVISYFR